jgi:TPP-dependent pyruvate/acetoin dehydrogenase alpha subunit
MTTNYRSMLSLGAGAPADADDLLAKMLTIRTFEDEIVGLFAKNLVRGSTHLCQGQEAITVGISGALSPGDMMTCTYRGHGATLAMGAAADKCFGEMLGRAGGIAQGRGGSMHFTDVSIGALGSNAIVGAHLPITVGAALSASYLGTGAVAVAYLGDGATNIGAFHEAVNLAAVWKLPAIFVIENNQYGEYSALAKTTPISRLADRATSYGIPGYFVDGNDVVTMREVGREAVARARAGEGPTLIEADTYRHSGHSRSDPATYRPQEEVEYWLGRDPITRLEQAMLHADPGAQGRIDQIRATVKNDVAEARDRALSWPEPDVEQRFEDVYA